MKKLLFFTMLCTLWSMATRAQSAENDGKMFIGINAGHTIVAANVNTALYPGTFFIPVHINAYRPLSKHFTLSGLLLFRGFFSDYELTNEFGFALGPCYTHNYLNGFFADCKIGFGFVTGRNDDRDPYSRSDLILMPEAGYFLNLSEKLTMTFGFGIQSLLRMRENPRMEDTGWERDAVGKMAQYYLPVANISIGFKL